MHAKLLSLFLCLASTVIARPTEECEQGAAGGKALYLINNEAANSVVAMPIGADGMLSAGTSTETRGAGSNSVNADGQPAIPDALVGQSALTVVGQNLFAVNAGSNTITMFKIDKADPTKLTMVGEPVTVPGEFPNTVAASGRRKLVCVGTTGAVAGVSCAHFSQRGIAEMDALRPFDLQQTTPPVGPTNTVSQVFFSDDQHTLFATVKGDPAVNNTGFLAAFPVNTDCRARQSSVSMEGTRSSPEGTAVLFGSTAIPGSSDIFVTDASFGGAVLSIDDNGSVSEIARGEVEGQTAICWATFSPASGTAFVTDVAVNRIVEMSVEDASVMGTIDLTNGDPGLIDLRAAGDFIYALSPGNGTTEAAVTVVNVMTMEEVQHFQLGSMGVTGNAMGMAVSM